MASTYVTQAFPDPVPIDHGDAVHYNPENAITDAGIGYEGSAPETLNDRFVFGSDISSAWYNDTGVPSADLGYTHDYYLDDSTHNYYKKIEGSWTPQGNMGGAGGGNVTGPSSSTDNAIARYDGTPGTVLLNSTVTLDDDGNIAGLNTGVFTAIASPAYAEGTLFYDDGNKTLTFYNDQSTVALQLGRENWVRSVNNTGSNILNGRVVYVSGVSGGFPAIMLAQPDEYNKSRIIGVSTQQINNGNQGEVTSFGFVNDIDTSGLSTGPVYLDHDGVLTSTKPTASHFVVLIGTCLVVDGSVGKIFVNPVISETTVEVADTNGFPNRTDSTMSFDDGSLTFTIEPTGTHFHYYLNGNSVMVESADTTVIDGTEGLHVIYYDDIVGTLTSVANPNAAEVDVVIRTKCIVAYVYWNADDTQLEGYFADERHGISMSPSTHAYIHFTNGAKYLSGLSVGDLVINGDGNAASDAQFSMTGGFIVDEDVITSPSTIGSTTGLPIYYLDGAAGNMRRIIETGFSVLTDTTAGIGSPTGRLAWNEFTGGAWQLTTVSSNDFVLCHVFAINGLEAQDQTIAVVGQAEYANAAQARAGASTEISNILVGFPFEEIVPIASIIFQTGNVGGYGNDVQARARPAADGDYVDWRTTELAQGVTASSHSNLTNLTTDDHLQYALTDGTRDTWTQTLQGDATAALATGDGKLYFTIPANLNGRVLTSAHAAVYAASSSGLPSIQIHNLTDTVDMLSTAITLDVGEYNSYTATTPPVVNTANDDVATGDIIRVDVDGAGTDVEGLDIILVFENE